MSEFKDALVQLEASIKSENKELVEKSMEALEAKFGGRIADSSEEVKQLVKDQIEAAESLLTKKFDEFSAKLNEKKSGSANGKDFKVKMQDFIAENFDKISGVREGKGVSFDKMEMKTVANMLTTGDHVTGDYIRDYNRTVIMLPGDALNVADLIPTITIDGGTYTYVRETAGEGAVAAQTEGSDKGLVDFNFSHIDVTTDFLAGRTVYSKKMRNNLQYLQSFLPDALRRQYFKVENSTFYGVINGAATASSELAASHATLAEQLTAELATLEAANYNGANGAVLNIASWYSLIEDEKSSGAGYGLPIGYTYEGGVLRAFGIPVMKAPWVAANKYLVGDWSKVQKVVTEGLSLEFSDQERFSKNEIVARIEAQVACAVTQPASMIFGDFTAST